MAHMRFCSLSTMFNLPWPNVDRSGIADRACGLSSGTRQEWIAYPGTNY